MNWLMQKLAIIIVILIILIHGLSLTLHVYKFRCFLFLYGFTFVAICINLNVFISSSLKFLKAIYFITNIDMRGFLVRHIFQKVLLSNK